MRPQHLFIITFVLLSSAAAAPFLQPNKQSMNNLGSSLSRSLRGWSNRGLNTLDDSIPCDQYHATTNGGLGDDAALIKRKM